MSEKARERERMNKQEKKLKEIDWDKIDWNEFMCKCGHGGSHVSTIRQKENDTK